GGTAAVALTVYVDDLKPVIQPNPNWRWESSCHLWADTEDELHAFAKRIGLRRGWFQPHHLLPHYDLTAPRRRGAIREGAVAVNAKEYLRKLGLEELRRRKEAWAGRRQ
ncbi:MAG: DUF4031 domain-containing protein, partial [Dehalococcoidia bacterium]|nr:DUF4031 domain-containing protein [Dehalococcoidia bacterium]